MAKKGGGIVEKPVFVPPPAAPVTSAAATVQDAVTPQAEAQRKLTASKMGASSLQIPVSNAGTIGLGQ